MSFFNTSAEGGTEDSVRSLLVLRSILLVLVLVVIFAFMAEDSSSNSLLLLVFGLSICFAWTQTALFYEPIKKWHGSAFRELVIDYLWVLGVVLLFGRTSNPFIYYYLVLTAFSASLLSAYAAWLFCGFGVLIYSALIALDVGVHFHHFPSDFRTHLVGMWLNFVGSSVVVCFFVTKLIQRLRAQNKRIMAIREDHLKNEQLIGLATISASTVHNLATPLSTLNVLVDEVASSENLGADVQEDLQLMRRQIQRCRDTMDELSYLAQKNDDLTRISVKKLSENLMDHYSLHYPGRNVSICLDCEDSISMDCNPLFHYALVNLINNAFEASTSEPKISIRRQGSQLAIEIINESTHNSSAVLARWGRVSSSEKESGLGIGSLLANSTIERMGGNVNINFFEGDAEESRVVVTVLYPISGESSNNE